MTVSPETIARFVIPSTASKPRVRRRLTEDGETEVMEMRARGFTYAEIASRVGVAWGTVKKCVQRNSQPGHTRWDIRRVEVDRMRAMRAEGMTYDEISSATGRSRGAVYRWVTGKVYST